MLAGKPCGVEPGQLAKRGGGGPSGEATFARRMAGPGNARQAQRLSDREAIVLRRALPWLGGGEVRPGKAAAVREQLTVDNPREVELLGLMPERSDVAVRERVQTQAIGRRQALQQIICLAQVGDGDGAGLPVDAARLDDVPVGVASNPAGLQTCHGVVVYAHDDTDVKRALELVSRRCYL